MEFHVPPRNQGQIVEVSYAMTDDANVIRRTCDASDRSTRYEIAPSLPEDEGDYWNAAPPFTRMTWRTMTAAEMKRYELD